MRDSLLRPLLIFEFLVAIIAVFTLWSQVGGQYHLDLMFWPWKIGFGRGSGVAHCGDHGWSGAEWRRVQGPGDLICVPAVDSHAGGRSRYVLLPRQRTARRRFRRRHPDDDEFVRAINQALHRADSGNTSSNRDDRISWRNDRCIFRRRNRTLTCGCTSGSVALVWRTLGGGLISQLAPPTTTGKWLHLQCGPGKSMVCGGRVDLYRHEADSIRCQLASISRLAAMVDRRRRTGRDRNRSPLAVDASVKQHVN